MNQIGHVTNIPTMQFFTGISRHTQSKSGWVWEFQNNTLWDTHIHIKLLDPTQASVGLVNSNNSPKKSNFIFLNSG